MKNAQQSPAQVLQLLSKDTSVITAEVTAFHDTTHATNKYIM